MRSWLRRGNAAALVAMLVAALTAACGGDDGGDSGGGPAKLRIAYQVIPNGAPILKNQRWLEDTLKIPVEWRQFDSGSDVNRAVASGSVDIGLAGSTLVANGIASNLQYEVPWIYDVIGDNEALVVKKDRKINTVADLVGKRIATPLGSTTQYSLVAALQQAGVDPKKVSIIDMKPPDALAAWQRGDIDGSYVWHPTLQKMIDDGGKVLVTSGQLAQKGIVTADLGIVSKSFAKKHPDTVAEWLRQEDRAAKMIKNEPAKAAAIVAKEFGISEKEATAQMKDLIILDGEQQLGKEYLGDGDARGALGDTLRKTAQFLVDGKIIPMAPDKKAFEDAVNPTYLKTAMGGRS